MVQHGNVVRETPAIILVEPQLGWNIGSVARAMLNFGLKDLRLVSPRDGWPNPDAEVTAAGARDVLDNVKVFPSFQDAMADLEYVIAASARRHHMVKEVYSPDAAAKELTTMGMSGHKIGIAFGNESSGLTSDDISLVNAVMTYDTNPNFSSMNLAHAVMLMAYEWHYNSKESKDDSHLRMRKAEFATKQEVNGFLTHMEEELDSVGFLTPKEKRPGMVRNIRSIFERIDLTKQEVRTLRGIVRYLRYGSTEK